MDKNQSKIKIAQLLLFIVVFCTMAFALTSCAQPGSRIDAWIEYREEVRTVFEELDEDVYSIYEEVYDVYGYDTDAYYDNDTDINSSTNVDIDSNVDVDVEKEVEVDVETSKETNIEIDPEDEAEIEREVRSLRSKIDASRKKLGEIKPPEGGRFIQRKYERSLNSFDRALDNYSKAVKTKDTSKKKGYYQRGNSSAKSGRSSYNSANRDVEKKSRSGGGQRR